MKIKLLLVCLFIGIGFLRSQTDKEIAYEKAIEGVKLMDEGKVDESIKLLKESKKLDPKNHIYSYEIGLAYIFKKDYKKAISELNKTKKYKDVQSQTYQLLGNAYSMSGKVEKALFIYREGLEKFPSAGNLYLETGNVYSKMNDLGKAILNYEKGIEVDPKYSTNYFRIAEIFLNSSDKVPGLIYGEIFMNLERTTERTKEMSKMLYKAYNESIQLSQDSSSVDFCEIILTATDTFLSEDFELPYCAIFGKNFVLAILGQVEFNLTSLSEMREAFVKFYFLEDSKKYPNILFDYHKKMMDEDLFESYNHYLFQIGNEEEFEAWLSKNEQGFKKFVEWYVLEENELELSNDNKFLRTQY